MGLGRRSRRGTSRARSPVHLALHVLELGALRAGDHVRGSVLVVVEVYSRTSSAAEGAFSSSRWRMYSTRPAWLSVLGRVVPLESEQSSSEPSRSMASPRAYWYIAEIADTIVSSRVRGRPSCLLRRSAPALTCSEKRSNSASIACLMTRPSCSVSTCPS